MLSENAHINTIFAKVKSCFSDYALFDDQVGESLRSAIVTKAMDIPNMSGRKITQLYFDVNDFESEEQKKALFQLDLVFETAHVLMLAMHRENQSEQWFDTEMLLNNYPTFRDVDDDELNFLLKYRNAVKIALKVFPARRNKARIMAIAAKLEGSHRDYITGTGQSLDVKRRVKIYEQEGDVVPEERGHRERKLKMKFEDPGSINSEKICPYSVKKAKTVCLPPSVSAKQDVELLYHQGISTFLNPALAFGPAHVAAPVVSFVDWPAQPVPAVPASVPVSVLASVPVPALTVTLGDGPLQQMIAPISPGANPNDAETGDSTSDAAPAGTVADPDPYDHLGAPVSWWSSLRTAAAQNNNVRKAWTETSLGFFLGPPADPQEFRGVF